MLPDSPYSHVRESLDAIPNLPATVMKGSYNKVSLHKFLKESGLANMHDLFELDHFKDLLYDTTLRTKIEVMAMNGFRPHEIESEIRLSIPEIDSTIVRMYLDCFADYSDMDYNDKFKFINTTFEEPKERAVYLKCLQTKSKDSIRNYIKAQARPINHIEMINHIARIVSEKIQENLIADNDEKLRDFIKDGFKTIDALDKLGVGNQDAARQLLEALSKKPEDVGVVSPKPMSVEQLEDMFLENQKPPTPK